MLSAILTRIVIFRVFFDGDCGHFSIILSGFHGLWKLPNFLFITTWWYGKALHIHYTDVIMGTISSQITSLTIVYSTVYSGADQRKHQRSASLAFVWGIHRRPVNSPHKWPVTRKMFPFDDVIMYCPFVKGDSTGKLLSQKPVMRAFYVSLMFARTSYWTNTPVTGDLKHPDAHVTSL